MARQQTAGQGSGSVSPSLTRASSSSLLPHWINDQSKLPTLLRTPSALETGSRPHTNCDLPQLCVKWDDSCSTMHSHCVSVKRQRGPAVNAAQHATRTGQRLRAALFAARSGHHPTTSVRAHQPNSRACLCERSPRNHHRVLMITSPIAIAVRSCARSHLARRRAAHAACMRA